MASHRIHLKGPWDYSLKASDVANSTMGAIEGTAKMPQDWEAIFGVVAGVAQFRRKFHRPTNLEPHERVILVLSEVRGMGDVRLNDTLIGSFDVAGGPVQFDVTAALKSFNEVTVELKFDPTIAPRQPGGLFGAVALEIQNDDA